MPLHHLVYALSALQWLPCALDDGCPGSMTLKGLPSGGVKETVVSVAPFPCLHAAVTQGPGGSRYLLDSDWCGLSWWKIIELLSHHL